MADLQEETVGEAVGEPRQEKEAIPISQKDVKENGELPESLGEIGGKEKEDLTLNNTVLAAGHGDSAVTSSEEAPRDGGQVQEEGATPVPPTEEEHGSSTMHSIQETFLSFVGLGAKPSREKAPAPDVPRAEKEEGTKSEEAEKVPPVADGVPQSTETESTETPEKGQTEETPETVGQTQTKTEEGLEGIPKYADTLEPAAWVADEEIPNSVDGPKTEAERGTIEQVDTAKTDDALKTQVGDPAESTETNETQDRAVSEAEIAKSQVKSDDAPGIEVAEKNIPTSTIAMNEAHAEVAKGAISKADGTTERDALEPHVGESKSPKASKVVAPFYKVVAKVAEAVEKVVSKEGNSAADAGQATPATEDSVEPRKIEEGINSQEVVAAPPPTPVEQEQPAVEADDPPQPKSFFGVVLKHVAPNGLLSTEGSPMGNHNSSNDEGSDNVDKYLEEAHEKEHAVPSDVSQGKEVAQTEADEPPKVEAGSDPTTSSDTPAVLEAVSTKLSKTSATGTHDFAEEGTVDDSTKETGVSAPEVEEKETPPPEVSRELPGGASEEGKSPMASGSTVVAPFYKVVANVAEVVENKVSPEEQGKTPNETNAGEKLEEAVETKKDEDIPQEGSKEAGATPGGASEEGKSPMASGSTVVAPFYKVAANVAEVVENKVSPEEQGKTPNETNAGEKLEEAAETKQDEDILQEGSKQAGDIPGGASEEGKSPMASGSTVVAPFYKVAANVAEVVENKVSPEEQGKTPNETNAGEKLEEAAETKQDEDIPQEGSKEARDTPGGASEEGKSPMASGSTVVAPFYKVAANVAEVVENKVSPEELGKTPEEQEKVAILDGSALEKQPSLSVNIPKQGKAAAADPETPEEETFEDLTTPRGTPLMQRVEHLEQKLAQLESRQSPRSDFASTGQSTPRSSVDRPFKLSTRYVLEETGSKGTLLGRVAALEQKLAHINLHPQSPSPGLSTPSISTVAENSSTEVDSKPAESQTQEWSQTAAEDDKAPEQVKSEEVAKATEDPLKPRVEENGPQDLSAQAEPAVPQKTSRSNSLSDKKVKAKAAAGKIKGLFSGCFHPKKGKTASSTAS